MHHSKIGAVVADGSLAPQAIEVGQRYMSASLLLYRTCQCAAAERRFVPSPDSFSAANEVHWPKTHRVRQRERLGSALRIKTIPERDTRKQINGDK